MYKRRKTSKKDKRTKLIVRRTLQTIAETKYSAEIAFFNGDQTTVMITPQAVLHQFLIEQGFGVGERVGNKIKIARLEFSVRVYPLTGATMTDGSYCRFVLLHDRDFAGAAIGNTDVFAVDTRPMALYNPAKVALGKTNAGSRRFRVLKDFTHTMVGMGTNGATVVTSGPQLVTMFTIPEVEGKQVTYATVDSAITDIVGWNLHLLLGADTASCCGWQIYGRLFYTDV